MKKTGIDCGASSIKLICLEDGKTVYRDCREHFGNPHKTLKDMLCEFKNTVKEMTVVSFCGCCAPEIHDKRIIMTDDIPAVTEGCYLICPQAKSVIDIGSRNERFISISEPGKPPVFSVNEHCAGGTGSFFENQMSRLGMDIKDYSSLVKDVENIPHISGRCAVFAKTDIIHRQQEGSDIKDILLGLCYAMIRNYKAVIVKKLPVNVPVVLCGGTALNTGVIRAVKEVFGLDDNELIELAQQYAQGEVCYPVFDLDFGKQAMAMSMIKAGEELGFSKPKCMSALLAGSAAVKKYTEAVEKQGRELLSALDSGEKVLVLITRPYDIADPVLNMGIPDLLLERGCKLISLEHLPGHSIDISDEYPNMYWPFGQHIISGAKMIKKHPNLYAVYLTNHGCGPDTMLTHIFRREMGDKPYLQIEVDEHYSPVGVITRIEAFLNSLEQHKPVISSVQTEINDVEVKKYIHPVKPHKERVLWIPDLGYYSDLTALYLSGEYGTKVNGINPKIPVHFMTVDADNDDSEIQSLRSFLYYI